MTVDKLAPPPSRKRSVVWVIVVAVIVVGISVLGSIVAGIDGLIAAATIATALGTLALAWQTFALAKATRKAVEESSTTVAFVVGSSAWFATFGTAPC